MFPQTTSLQNPSLLTKRPQPFFSSRAPCLRAKSKPDSSPDIITRLFGAVFGQQALEDKIPFGLKRMEDQDMYELYPATTTDFAEPVEGDDESVALFRPLLAKTRLEKAATQVCEPVHTLCCLQVLQLPVPGGEPAREGLGLNSPCLPGQDGLLCERAWLEPPGFPVALQWLWSCGERLFGLVHDSRLPGLHTRTCALNLCRYTSALCHQETPVHPSRCKPLMQYCSIAGSFCKDRRRSCAGGLQSSRLDWLVIPLVLTYPICSLVMAECL